MKPIIERSKGWTEVIIDGDCEFEKFYKVADVLQADFNILFTNKLHDLDTIYWDFNFKDSTLVLFYNIYEGVTIFPKALQDSIQTENECTEEIGTLLYQKLLELG